MKNNCGSLEVLRWTGFLLKEKKIRSSFFFIEIFLSFKKESVDTFEIGARWREKIRSTFLLRIDRTPKRHNSKRKTGSFMIELQKKSHFFSLFYFVFSVRSSARKRKETKTKMAATLSRPLLLLLPMNWTLFLFQFDYNSFKSNCAIRKPS